MLFPVVMLLLAAARAAEIDRFVLHVNLLRLDPYTYRREYNATLACEPIAASLRVVTPSVFLNASAAFQAETVSQHGCPVSHTTCPGMCERFGGCGVTERITAFLPTHTSTATLPYVPHAPRVAEVLTQGPRHPMTSLSLFLHSHDHCTVLLDPAMDSIGAAFYHRDRNVMVVDLATLGRDASAPAVFGALDGDLYIAYSSFTSDDAVFLAINGTEHAMTPGMWGIRGLFSAPVFTGEKTRLVYYWFRHGTHHSQVYRSV